MKSRQLNGMTHEDGRVWPKVVETCKKLIHRKKYNTIFGFLIYNAKDTKCSNLGLCS